MSYGQNPYGQPGQPYGQPAPQPGWNPAPQQPGYPPQGGQGWGPQQPPNQPAWPSGPTGYPGTAPAQPNGQPPSPSGTGWPPGTGKPSAPTSEAPAQPVPPTPVPEPEPRQATFAPPALPVSTTDSIAGHEVAGVLGPVVGVVTQPRDLKPGPELTVTLTEIRQEAVQAMVAMAVDVDADAVVGLHFDTGPVSGSTSEVVAYGTAVILGAQRGVLSVDEAELDVDVEAADEVAASAEIDAAVDEAAAAVEEDTDTTIHPLAQDGVDPRLADAGTSEATQDAEESDSDGDQPAPKRARGKVAK